MTPKQRWAILGSLLFATLLAGYLIDDEPVPERPARQRDAAVRAAGVREDGAGKPPAVAPLQFPEPVAAGGDEAAPGIDPFRAKSWYVAPPPPPPAKPTAPPLPFQYLGKLDEDGEIRVFLNHQGRHLIARVGDVIADTYFVEEIAGGRMTFLYQPLKETQVLAIGADK